jgi:hypothetical protein
MENTMSSSHDRASGPSIFCSTSQNPTNQICMTWRCSAAARITHVPSPGGQQQRLCPRHVRDAEQIERVDHVRRELVELFRGWPLEQSRGAIGATQARTFANFAEVERRPA